MTEHRCHAQFCGTPCPPEQLMCSRHWNMVPKPIQDAVWRTYRSGQCDDKNPSREWLAAASKAVMHVREIEEGMVVPGRDGKAPLWAITVRQPWASLLAAGIKDIENREWNPHPAMLGKNIAIHAGKSLYPEEWFGAINLAETRGIIGGIDLLSKARDWKRSADGMSSPRLAAKTFKSRIEKAVPNGAIVAIAQIRQVYSAHESPWFVGPIGWLIENVLEIVPVPVPGAQGFWRVQGDALVRVRANYGAALAALRER